MKPTLFISDLHLSPERPELIALFGNFLRARGAEAQALYILGDLFEVWLGDDAVHPAYQTVLAGLRSLTEGGVPVYVMHGNRDFLLGADFEKASGGILIGDPALIDLNGERTLLMHGDVLCTDDVEYQQFRRHVRNPETQRQFLAMSVEQRIATARQFRDASRERSRYKAEDIMDVNQAAVAAAMRDHGVRLFIHGHTHRPALHRFDLDGQEARRIVLGDWHEQGSVLVCDQDGCRLETISAA